MGNEHEIPRGNLGSQIMGAKIRAQAARNEATKPVRAADRAEAWIHRAPQRHQRMLQVNDLIEPGAKQILLSRLPPSRWPSGPSPKPSKASESQIKFSRNPLPHTRFPANSITPACRFQIPNQQLGNSSRTNSETREI